MGKLLINGKLYNPVKMGDTGDWYAGEQNAVCGDCGVKFGEQHLPGCDIERWPVCGRQLISCNCGEVYDVAENAKEEEVERLLQEQIRQQEME